MAKELTEKVSNIIRSAKGEPLKGPLGKLTMESSMPEPAFYKELTFNGVYNALKKFYDSFRLKLTDISRYLPR